MRICASAHECHRRACATFACTSCVTAACSRALDLPLGVSVAAVCFHVLAMLVLVLVLVLALLLPTVARGWLSLARAEALDPSGWGGKVGLNFTTSGTRHGLSKMVARPVPRHLGRG